MESDAYLVEVYSDKSGADKAAEEHRDSGLVSRVRVVKRTVRAFGRTTTVWVVATWRGGGVS